MYKYIKADNIYAGKVDENGVLYTDEEVISKQEYEERADIKKVVAPNCKEVMGMAFDWCTNLTAVSLPKCMEVGFAAFRACTSLTEIELPQCKQVGEGAFIGCEDLKEISLPQCKKMGHSVFENCISLQKAMLPQCESVGEWAFDGCTNLKNVDLPTGVKVNIPNSINTDETDREKVIKLNEELESLIDDVWVDEAMQEVFANTELGETAIGYLDELTVEGVLKCLKNFKNSDCYEELFYGHDFEEYDEETIKEVTADIQWYAKQLKKAINSR